MNRTLSLVIAVTIIIGIICGCTADDNPIPTPDINNEDELQNVTVSQPSQEDEKPTQYRARVHTPNLRLAEDIEFDIINNAGIDYELTEDYLYIDSDENVMLTIESFSADGTRLMYERRYPGELGRNSVSTSNHAHRGIDVAKWVAYIDYPDNSAENEMRLMSWLPLNSLSGIQGLCQFKRTSAEQFFRPLVLPYDSSGRIIAAGVPGMDDFGEFGDDAENLIWSTIPDMSTSNTKYVEITVAENYEPDDNGIRFLCVGSPGRVDTPISLLIACDVPELTITYSQGTETLTAVNGIIYTTLKLTTDERQADTITVNGREYPKLFFGEYQRNIPIAIDEFFGQPWFKEEAFTEYTIDIADVEK